MARDPVAVVGAGAWGTALANAAALAGRKVVLWTRDPEHARLLSETRTNARFLPGVPLAPGMTVTAALGDLAAARLVLLVVPAQAVREVAAALTPVIAPGTPVVVCAKGIERGSGRFMTEVVAEVMPAALPAVLSGPSFAGDVARGLPTAVVLAAADEALAAELAAALSSPTFRIYHGGDPRGVEIGGAAKNVLAIACGIVMGRRLGESARAALVARGFAELTRFARAWGGRPETLMGLSGLGDLVLTCGSPKSRNFAFGDALGRGVPAAEAAGGRLAEGALTAAALVAMARARGVEMPVAEAVDAVLSGALTVGEAIDSLLHRPIRAEA
ncbi:NAD(P)H-dependent glycerol-3-phosphate dehydrogenase [Chelatococcus sp. SYSU_G07232]|uniref:Glycerol-3-phosphate dehydrogenase [NAD(P)+] n=1 Tax=Chelatococcus albus TaxID=3047466 RepID=A0ABT7AK90_9HYPH|nr:NAD(P)H-dependent glycerol-3-phosphate dehydrogenase [Chelatococcus sp. SYSU_G07232]MDJ1159782.1 NAD(P)H-dependent glycerol-3-phosphate dehydrogenase [Chelatococcus sp. SYSU_G07232]